MGRPQHPHRLGELRRFILKSVRLIDNQVLPRKFAQGVLLEIADFVGRDQAVPVSLHAWAETLFDQLGAFILLVEEEGGREG